MKFFFDLARIPVMLHVKIILRVLLLSWTVEKTKKKSHLDPQNGPFCSDFYYIVALVLSKQLTTCQLPEKYDQKSPTFPSKGGKVERL